MLCKPGRNLLIVAVLRQFAQLRVIEEVGKVDPCAISGKKTYGIGIAGAQVELPMELRQGRAMHTVIEALVVAVANAMAHLSGQAADS